MQKKLLSILFACSQLLLCLLFSDIVYSQESVNMFRGNSQLTGNLRGIRAVRQVEAVKFSFETRGAIRSVPAINNNVLYVGSTDSCLYAVNSKTGEMKWRYKTRGAVNSSPTIDNGIVFFTSRDNILYALQTNANGKLLWKFKMDNDLPFDQGFDYYLSSPNIHGDILYIGSGDGHLYALNKRSGSVIWKHFVNARIRSTPAVVDSYVVFGGLNGHVYALNKSNGKLLWDFETKGAGLKFDDAGYDQTSIICSPAVNHEAVFVGGRDGFLYAIDIKTGKEKWKVTHEGSWVLATGIDEQTVYATSGTAAFVQAVDIATGREKWKYKASGIVYSSPMISEDVLYYGDYAGNVFALDKNSGNKLWAFPLGSRIFSSPVIADETIYAASDNGVLFALQGKIELTPAKAIRKVVYWEPPRSSREFNWFNESAVTTIRSYFKNSGYEELSGSQLKEMMQQQLLSKDRSVVVLAANKIPKEVIGDSSEQALIRKYLNAGGKIVMIGPNPLGFKLKDDTGEFYDLDFQTYPQKIFGLNIQDKAFVNWGSVYHSMPTVEGYKWGLRKGWIGAGSVSPGEVTTVLALNEHGGASSWLKSYGGPRGTGLLQLCVPVGRFSELAGDHLAAIRAVTEYGIEW